MAGPADDEPPEVLSVGVVYDWSPNGSAWTESLRELSRSVSERRAGIPSPLNVNVVFQVPGRLVPCDFEGVRTGRYDAVQRHLLMQVAVPVERFEEADLVSRQLLRDAIAEAERWARRRGIAEGLPELKALAERA
jgi:hypothetical protein